MCAQQPDEEFSCFKLCFSRHNFLDYNAASFKSVENFKNVLKTRPEIYISLY